MKTSSSQPHLTPFPLPDPAVARHPNVLLTARELLRWLDSLPLGNPPRVAQQILQQLRLLARDPQPGPRLSALLDCYTPTLDRLRQVTDARLPSDSESALPLDQLELLMLDLVAEQACGYLRACNAQLVVGKAPALTTLYSAAKLLDEAAMLASLHYHRAPQPHWRLLLHTYLLAEQLGLANQAVDPKKSPGDGSDTIHGVFFCTLLIACCDPHHHQPARVGAWHAWLERHTDSLALVPLPQGNAAIPIDISGELSPLAAARTAKPGRSTQYVTADTLLEQLKEDPEAPIDLLTTLTALVRGRRTPEQRRAPREALDQPYQLLFGLHNIASRLLSLSNNDAGNGAPIIAGRQINRSKTGAAFTLTGPLRTPPSIGEPVLAEASSRGTNGTAVGFLARVQRVVFDPAQNVDIGVEKVPGRVMPVTITGSAAERVRGDVGALLLHSPERSHYTLIAPKRLFREGDMVSVEGPSVRHNLRMLEQSGGSRRFAYIEVEVMQS